MKEIIVGIIVAIIGSILWKRLRKTEAEKLNERLDKEKQDVNQIIKNRQEALKESMDDYLSKKKRFEDMD